MENKRLKDTKFRYLDICTYSVDNIVEQIIYKIIIES